MHLLLGGVPLLLPPALAHLVAGQLAAAPPRAFLQSAAPDERWLFPGRHPGNPITAEALNRKLHRIGIRPRLSRNTALAAWACELPEPVLAELLGVTIDTAIKWARVAGQDWATYLAARAATTHTARPE